MPIWVMQDGQVQLTDQRLRELMLWHGKDEGNLPPAATLANLSQDTVAALGQLQQVRSRLEVLRALLAQLFWVCEASDVRRALLAALGAPPEGASAPPALPGVAWQASPNGLPPAQAAEPRSPRYGS
jgi:hypothetical protein